MNRTLPGPQGKIKSDWLEMKGGGACSPTSSPLPHPELTLQQKQHLRERNLHPHSGESLQYTSTGIPIRPFLTRGSVAERVLIFEKCPAVQETKERSPFHPLASASAAEKKRAATCAAGTGGSASGAPADAPNSWRRTSDVQTKTQVSGFFFFQQGFLFFFFFHSNHPRLR